MSGTGTTNVDLTGRRAIVTGGASGIGRATAHRLSGAGASVLVTDVDEPGGAAVAEEIGGAFTPLDVADAEAWTLTLDRHGPFEIAFLNAGVSTGEQLGPTDLPVAGMDDDLYRRIMGVNVDGVVFGARAVLPHMIASGHGDIVCTASLAGLVPVHRDPIYGLTKHAVVGFVRSMARATDDHGLDVCLSAICPGFVDTNIIDDTAKAMIRANGIGILDPSAVADVVLRALAERRNGAQWVVWEGAETSVYEWNPAIDPGSLPGPPAD